MSLLSLHNAMVLIHGQAIETLLAAVRPGDGQPARGFLAESEQQPSVTRGSIRSATLGEARLLHSRHVEDGSGSDNAGVVLALQLKPEPVMALAADAAQDRGWLVHVADDKVRTAIIVQ